jgi:hypothetical protein
MMQSERNRKKRSTERREDIRAGFFAAAIATVAWTGAANAQVLGSTTSAVTEQLFDSVNSSVCTISAIAIDGTYVSRGSGFILKDSGLLVTNAHVVAGLRQATARCGDTQLDIRRIVRFDADVDLAVGEVGTVDVPGLSLATEGSIRPGSQVFVFGSPWGLEGTISPGLASGRRVIDGRSYIQISGPISAGNSGGPVTDDTGAVLGIAVASLEADNNISFAIPAAAITALPEVDMQTVELAVVAYGASASPPAAQQAPTRPARPVATANGAAFRGNMFGSPCGDVAVAEYGRKRPSGPGRGDIRFDQWYDGQLEMDVDLLGTPATVFYNCDRNLGMTAGYYRIRGNAEGISRIESVLRGKYGSGIVQPISETDATERGCLFNFSLPGSRYYRPSQLTSWRVDDRFHIDLLECGGRSTMTFLFYSDPVLVANASAMQSAAPDTPGYAETDL